MNKCPKNSIFSTVRAAERERFERWRPRRAHARSPRTTSVYEPRRLSLVASLSGPSSRFAARLRLRLRTRHTLPVTISDDCPRFVFTRVRARAAAPLFERRDTQCRRFTYAFLRSRAFPRARARPCNGIVHLSSPRRDLSAKIMVSATQSMVIPARVIESRAFDSTQSRLVTFLIV